MGSRKAGARRARHGDGQGSGRARTPVPDLIASAARPGLGGHFDPLSLALDALVLGLAAFYLFMLWRQSAPASFSSDECFHAYVSEWIAQRGRLPRELPEFYSGLPYFYPPLFHILGAAAVKVAGLASLKYLNVVFTGILMAVVCTLPVPGLTRAARRCAVLLCIASKALSFYAVVFYAETLATLMAVLVVLLLLRARARPGTGEGVLLGVALGAALVSKQSAPVLAVLVGVLAAIDFARRRRPAATTMLIALVTGLIVALPYYVRNAVLFGGPFYPPITNDAQAALDAMNTRIFSAPAPIFYRNALVVMGPVVPWLTGAALVWNVARGRFNLVTGLLAGCVAFTLLAPFVPRFEPRHLNPVTAILALLGSLVVADALARRRWVSFGAQLLLVGWGVVFVARMPAPRSWLNPSPLAREMYRAVAESVPAGGTVLSRSTYDTFYYARRNATWPIPWGRTEGQIELFTVRDPERFIAALDRLAVDYLLLPRGPTAQSFDGANFPVSYVACVATLVQRGRLEVVWGSQEMVLVGKSAAAASAPAGPADAPHGVATRTTLGDR